MVDLQLENVFFSCEHGKSILLQCLLSLLLQGEVMGTGHGTETIMGKANRAGGAQLFFFSLIWTVLFSVIVFAAVQHGGPEDSEERVVPIPLRVTALLAATVSRHPTKRKRHFLTYTDRATGFPKSGHDWRGGM